MPSRTNCLHFYSTYGALKWLTFAIIIVIVAVERKKEIDSYYVTLPICQRCFDQASSNPTVLFEFGKCSKDYAKLLPLDQHENLIRSYPWLRGPAGRSSGVYLYLVHAILAMVRSYDPLSLCQG